MRPLCQEGKPLLLAARVSRPGSRPLHQGEIWLDLAAKENEYVKATDGSVCLESTRSPSHGVPREHGV